MPRRAAMLLLILGLPACTPVLAQTCSEDFEGIWPPLGWLFSGLPHTQEPAAAHGGSQGVSGGGGGSTTTPR